MEPHIQRRSKRRGRFRRGTINFEIRSRPWGHQYRKENNNAGKLDRARAEKRKTKDLSTEYHCISLYSLERGGFYRPEDISAEKAYASHIQEVRIISYSIYLVMFLHFRFLDKFILQCSFSVFFCWQFFLVVLQRGHSCSSSKGSRGKM